jgi:glyoxylase-like metal-dependent hydrolase (beta-lactamase superfamily II)
MHNRNIAIRLVAIAALSAATFAWAQPRATPLSVKQIKGNVYWAEGGAGGNSGIIVGDKGVIVIDAKMTADSGKELLAEIAKITPEPVTHVILTHSDADHVNGLVAFPKDVNVIAHENNKKEQEVALQAGGPMAPPRDHLPNKVVMKNKETMKIDGVRFTLLHWAPAHTSGDLIIYLPDDKIVFTGDIIAGPGPDPLIHLEKHGSSEGWIQTVKGMVALDADTFVPGHGEIQDKANIEKRLKATEEKRAKIKSMVAEGKSLDDIKKSLGEAAPPAGGPGPRFASFTETTYKELAKK